MKQIVFSNYKRVFSFLFVLLFSTMKIFALDDYDIYVDGFYYNKILIPSGYYHYEFKGDVYLVNCNKHGSIVIPGKFRINSQWHYVKGIGAYAFSGKSGIDSITVSEGTEYIENNAFRNCSDLKKLTIPASITRIDGNVIKGCAELTTIEVNPDNNVYDSRERCNAIVETATNTLVAGCSSTVIPSDIKIIGESAFYGCTELETIIIPNGVTEIKDYAFGGCSNLTQITIPSSVTNIGNYVFADCKNLKKIIVDNNEIYDSRNNCNAIVETSSNKIIAGCANSIVYENIEIIGIGAFYGCSEMETFIVPNNVISIEENAFSGCSFSTMIIGTGVQTIAQQGFKKQPIKTIWLTNTPPSGYSNVNGTVNYVANGSYSLNNAKTYSFLSSMFVENGVRYVPVSPSERTCDAIDCIYDSTSAIISIDTTVTYRNIAMTVKEVNPYTFYGNDNTSVQRKSLND